MAKPLLSKAGSVGLSRQSMVIVKKPAPPKSYFTELTATKAIFYFLAVAYVFSAAVVVTFEPLIPLPCTSDPSTYTEFENPAYDADPCLRTRFVQLLFLTPEECMFGRRIVWSVILGGIVGWERRQADRPAGIRTMSLVSLGSCLFTINSAFAFLSGPMSWDASRISAAIPSGVGFLGAGMIFKEANKDEESGLSIHVVHGLTTAASLWLSAAVGIACGGGLYFAASFCVAIILVLLRFGPRQNDMEDEDEDDDEEEEKEIEEDRWGNLSPLKDGKASYSSLRDVEGTPIKRVSSKRSFRNKKAQLASIV